MRKVFYLMARLVPAACLAWALGAGTAPAQDGHAVRRMVEPPSQAQPAEPAPQNPEQTPPPGPDAPEWARVKPLYDQQGSGQAADAAARQAEQDRRLRKEIEKGMKLALFINSDKVRVQVKNGEAILTGKVFSWVERGAAERIAYASGAKNVRNYLSTAFGPSPSGR